MIGKRKIEPISSDIMDTHPDPDFPSINLRASVTEKNFNLVVEKLNQVIDKVNGE